MKSFIQYISLLRIIAILWITSGLSFFSFAQSCLPGGIDLTSQGMIDSFQINYPGCTEILGDLSIYGGSISNLNGLSEITSIVGDLYIHDVYPGALNSLSGLSSLATIGGSFSLSSCYILSNLIGLDELSSIGGNLYFYQDHGLESLVGLGSLSSIGGNLQFYDNHPDELVSLEALTSLSNIGGSLIIENCDVLTNLNGLNLITQLEGLFITGNNSLINLEGLNSLISIGSYLIITSNDELVSLSALSSVNNTTSGELHIWNNPSLTSLTGLDNIDMSFISNLIVGNCDQLVFCDVESICNYLAIPCNPSSIFGNAAGCIDRIEIEQQCNLDPSLVILDQPSNQTRNVCSQANFNVTVEGNPPFHYSWKKNGVTISGATNSSYTTPLISISDDGTMYSCVVGDCSNPYVMTSDTAILSVQYPCIYNSPWTVLSSSAASPGESVTINGYNFTPNSTVSLFISNEADEYVGQGIPITYLGNGNFEFILPITTSFIEGQYSVVAQDNGTGTSAPVKLFQIHNPSNLQLWITKPFASDTFPVGHDFQINWSDFITGGVPIGQSGHVQKTYDLEITSLGRQSSVPVPMIESIQKNLVVNQLNSQLSHILQLSSEGCYECQVTDHDNPNNTATSTPFCITSNSNPGFKASLEWDKSAPQALRAFPEGLCADGTSRILVQLKRNNTNKAVKSILAEIKPPNGVLTGELSEAADTLGKILFASQGSRPPYNLHGNEADSIANIKNVTNSDLYYFWYVAPDDFTWYNPDYRSKRSIKAKFTITYTDNSVEFLWVNNISVVRPPLILVHGIGGDETSFDDAKYTDTDGNPTWYNTNLDNKRISDLWLYSKRVQLPQTYILMKGGYSGYETNAKSLNQSIKDGIISIRNKGFACNRVDVVAHSMGGCTARKFVSIENLYYPNTGFYKNYDKGFINKLITISTPHNGSYFADFIRDLENSELKKILDPLNKAQEGLAFLLNSAIDIHCPGLKNLQAYSDGDQLPINLDLRNHLIALDVDPTFGLLTDNYYINQLVDNGGFLDFTRLQKRFLNHLKEKYSSVHAAFDEEYCIDDYLSNSDLVVPVSSQLAGTTSIPTNITTNPEGMSRSSILYDSYANHMGIQRNIIIGDRVFKLLNSQITSDFFANSIPQSTTNQNQNCQSNLNQPITRTSFNLDTTITYFDTLFIKIAEPLNNTITYVDSFIQISVQVKDTINLNRIFLYFQRNSITSLSKDSVQIFETSIYPEFIGKNIVVALAEYDSMGTIVNHIDTVYLNVKSLDTLQEFFVEPATATLDHQQIFLPSYYVSYPTFIGQLASGDDSLTYMIADTNVITFDNTNFNFTSKDTGSTYIVFAYQGFIDTVHIYISSNEETGVIIGCSFDTITLYSGIMDSLKSFQWQVDTLDGFNDISDGLFYSGSDSSTLLILNPLSRWYNYTYRCIISEGIIAEVSNIYTLRFRSIWTGELDSLWSHKGNWSCDTVPDSHTDVLIPLGTPFYPVILENAYCRTLELQDSALINVSSPNFLCVGGGNEGLLCPENITITLEPGESESIVEFSLDQEGSCNGVLVQTLGIESGGIFPLGTTTNCFEWHDEAGVLVGSCCFDVIVNNCVGYGVLCPNDTVITLSEEECYHQLFYSIAVDSMCNDSLIQISGIPSGGQFPIGTTYNCFELYSDIGILMDTCCFSVIINPFVSLEPLDCHSFTQLGLDANCSTTVNADLLLDGNHYGCYDSLEVYVGIFGENVNSQYLVYTPGYYSVTVYDPESGNSCYGDLQLSDTTPPSIICMDFSVSWGTIEPDSTTTPLFTDNCGDVDNFYYFDYISNGNCDSSCQISRTWVVFDDYGNNATCEQIITLLAPDLDLFECPANYVGECGEGFPYQTGFPMYLGNIIQNGQLCRIIVEYSDQDSMIPGGILVTRTWSAFDTCTLEEVECEQILTLFDTSAPDLSCPSDIEICCEEELDPEFSGEPYTYDPCSPVIVNYSDIIVAGDSIDVLYYVNRTWFAADTNGNIDSCLQIISVLPVNPELTCPNNMIVGINPGDSNAVVFYGISIICSCTDSLIQTAGIASGDTFPLGITTNCFELIDSMGLVIDSCCFDIEIVHACVDFGGYLTSQNLIDSFSINYPGCTHILTNMIINDDVPGNITNLNGLLQLKHIESLNIYDNDSLSSLSGLDSIETIGESVYLSNNSILTDLTGLNSLNAIEGHLYISSNPELSNMTGLNSLMSIGTYFYLTNNPSLSNFNGLNALSSIGEYFYISNNLSLLDFTGLNNLSLIGQYIQINNNDSLLNFIGLGSLNNVGTINITDNEMLLNFDGLNFLTSIGGSLLISNNSVLQNLEGLSSILSINGSITISDNLLLESLIGLDSINPTTITYLSITGSSNLSICNVQSICDYLDDQNNSASVFGNATGCATRQEIEEECGN